MPRRARRATAVLVLTTISLAALGGMAVDFQDGVFGHPVAAPHSIRVRLPILETAVFYNLDRRLALSADVRLAPPTDERPAGTHADTTLSVLGELHGTATG